MQSSDKTCCCFFSIETGANLIFLIQILDCVVMIFGMITQGLWAEYLPLFFFNVVFILMFAAPKYDRTMNTMRHRRRMAWYYFFVIAILGHLWMFLCFTGFGADEIGKICNDNGGADKWFNGNEKDCRSETRIYLICGLFVTMTVQMYYSFILKCFADERRGFEDPR